ncbi:MAG: DUF427 domain-containing protein [Anaerolineae bacterium]|nr:DUF427 domain-containing protein [Anaerolineae bacterium]NUQ03529.1 DUF427 domain-containing protein [Anaerolineae bacterium]
MITNRFDGNIIAQGIQGQDVHEIESGWYFPPEAVDTTHLIVTGRTYTCPYKGVCYWVDMETPDMHVQNVAWVYNQPKRGYEKIKDYIGFSSRGSAGTTVLVEERA